VGVAYCWVQEENTHRKNVGWETLPSSSVKLGKLPVASMAEPATQLERGVDKIAIETAGRKRVSGEGTR
jgi:hypothetical protein